MNCFSTLPTNLHFKPSLLPEGGYEVWSTETIPSGTRFGPFEGVISRTSEHQKGDFQHQVEGKEKEMIVNDCNEKNLSWLQLINYTCSKEQQNMIAIEYKSRIYFFAFKNIPANTELLVGLFYQDRLAGDIYQRTGDRRNCIQTEENSFEIDQDGRDRNTENCDIAKMKNNITLKTNVLYTNFLINTKLSRSSNFNAVQTPFSVCKYHNLAVKKENTSIYSKQFIERKCEEFKDNGQLNLSKSRRTNGETCEADVEYNHYETNCTGEKSYRKDLEEEKIKHHRLEFDETETIDINIACNKSRIKYIKDDQLNVPQMNHVDKNNISERKLEYELFEKGDIRDKLFQCTVCQKKFNNSKSLKTHVRIHIIGKRFECSVCQKKFHRNSHLMVHERIHTGEKPFQCIICQIKFNHKNSLKIHERTHTGEKPYECNFCQMKFRQKNSLTAHEWTHTGKKPYECNVCHKKFNRKYDLKMHERVHTGEKPYECNICQKKFNWKHDFKMHEWIHTGEQPHECHVCLKKFNRKYDLKLHERIHTDEKPYGCNTCEKKFKWKHDLKMHERIHTGLKPYECDACQKKFNRKYDLKMHQRIHTGEKPYACSACQKKFNRKYDLKMHEWTHATKNI